MGFHVGTVLQPKCTVRGPPESGVEKFVRLGDFCMINASEGIESIGKRGVLEHAWG